MAFPLHVLNHAFFPVASDPLDCAIHLNGPTDLETLVSDHNAFYQKADRPVVDWFNRPGGGNRYLMLAEWQALGFDLHSVIKDPDDPEVAANLLLYENRPLVPPLIRPNCCVRLQCNDLLTDCHFSQHMGSGGPTGWSDEVPFGDFIMWTYCGPCNRNGLLATLPTVVS